MLRPAPWHPDAFQHPAHIIALFSSGTKKELFLPIYQQIITLCS